MSLLAAAIVFVYGNSLSTPFQYDDFGALEDNAVQVAGRPIVRLSFALNHSFGGADVTGYHAVNIVVHIACAILFFFVARNALSRWATGEWQRGASTVAFWAALVWAIHPLNTGTVTYISARSESLMAMWYLATLLAAMHAYGSPRRLAWSVAAVVFCALGMATKETMVTAPVVVLLLDRAFIFSSFNQARLARGKLYAALAATWSVLAALMLTGARADSVGFSLGVSSWTYLLNQAEILTDYLRRSLWPYSLVFAYGEPRALTLADVLPQATMILSLVALACWSWWKARPIGVLGLAFFVVLMPTSSVVPIATEVGAERRMYLPLMALILIVVLIFRFVWNSMMSRVKSARNEAAADIPLLPQCVGTTVPMVLCVALAALTIQRNTDYATAEGLWRSTLDRWPSAIAHRNLATSLWQNGHRNEAIEHLRATVSQHPEVRETVGQSLYDVGRFDEALVELRTFLDHTSVPGSASEANARVMGAAALDKLGRWSEARDVLQELIARRPDFALAYLALGDLCFRHNEFADAQQAYRRFLVFQPTHEGALTNLGIAALNTGQPEEAIKTLQLVVDAWPQHPSAHRNLAVALADAGRIDQAIAHVEEAARLDPGDPTIRELSEQLHAAKPGR